MRNSHFRRLARLWLMTLVIVSLAQGSVSPQRTFDTPDLAVQSLIQAFRADDMAELKQILGPEARELLSSGDEVADAQAHQKFVNTYDEKHQLVVEKDGSTSLVIGNNDWPMPIPIVKDEKTSKWSFDTAAGKDEIINRRVGRNELDAVQVCLAIVDAQREYVIRDPDGDAVPEYTDKFLSDPGKKNGLYWKTEDGQEPSPLGELVASASEQGYATTRTEGGQPRPYHGYHYRMLKAQGSHANGGAFNYIVGGNMVGGFAVVSSPAEYGSSGIMTFIVNYEGVVYQRDLGEDTERIARSMTEFDPGPEWKKVEPVKP